MPVWSLSHRDSGKFQSFWFLSHKSLPRRRSAERLRTPAAAHSRCAVPSEVVPEAGVGFKLRNWPPYYFAVALGPQRRAKCHVDIKVMPGASSKASYSGQGQQTTASFTSLRVLRLFRLSSTSNSCKLGQLAGVAAPS